MTSEADLPDDAVAEIAARMFDGDLSRQPDAVQDAVWRDARWALFKAMPHLRGIVLREIAAECGVEQDDERLGYVTVQVNRETWSELKAALAE